ncbi:unnamed protein product [Ilex paraguariensis]|uniref:EF-hand domain-containing protein n=1 Tax=Ilex paraguariensis TaxID=185542 RepID=A0ABC8ST42_9AQUA
MSSVNSKDLHRIFEKLDKNGDGLVSLDELKWLLEKIGIHPSLDELELSMGTTTLDLIDFSLFYDTIIKSNIDKSKAIEEGNDMDSELVEAFKDCGTSMINVYDSNSDGVLDFEEFKNMMLPAKS